MTEDRDAVFNIRPVIFGMEEGPRAFASRVIVDPEYVFDGGSIQGCQYVIRDMLETLNDTGFLTVPVKGTVRAINKDMITKIDFVLEEVC